MTTRWDRGARLFGACDDDASATAQVRREGRGGGGVGARRGARERDPRDGKERDWCLDLARGRGVVTPGPHSIPYARGSVGIAAPVDRTQAN